MATPNAHEIWTGNNETTAKWEALRELEEQSRELNRKRIAAGPPYSRDTAEDTIDLQIAELIRELLKLAPVNAMIMHDCEFEADREDMRDKLKESLKHLKMTPTLVHVDIWLVLLVPGKDKWIASETNGTFDDEELTPSEWIMDKIDSGNGSLDVVCPVINVKHAMWALEGIGFWGDD